MIICNGKTVLGLSRHGKLNFCSQNEIRQSCKAMSLVCLAWLVSGCEVLTKISQPNTLPSLHAANVCLSSEHTQRFGAFCDPTYWFAYAVEVQEIKTQQDQVEQLFKIETDLIEQNRNEKR